MPYVRVPDFFGLLKVVSIRGSNTLLFNYFVFWTAKISMYLLLLDLFSDCSRFRTSSPFSDALVVIVFLVRHKIEFRVSRQFYNVNRLVVSCTISKREGQSTFLGFMAQPNLSCVWLSIVQGLPAWRRELGLAAEL